MSPWAPRYISAIGMINLIITVEKKSKQWNRLAGSWMRYSEIRGLLYLFNNGQYYYLTREIAKRKKSMVVWAIHEELNLPGFLFIAINQDGKEVLLENVFTLSQICCSLRTSLHMPSSLKSYFSLCPVCLLLKRNFSWTRTITAWLHVSMHHCRTSLVYWGSCLNIKWLFRLSSENIYMFILQDHFCGLA